MSLLAVSLHRKNIKENLEYDRLGTPHSVFEYSLASISCKSDEENYGEILKSDSFFFFIESWNFNFILIGHKTSNMVLRITER